MQMLTPQVAVVGANDVVVLDDSLLVVGTRHGGRVLPTDVPSLCSPGIVIVPLEKPGANGHKLRRWSQFPVSAFYKRDANAGKELHLIEGGASAEPSDPVRL
jgi:hypothetical protein